MALDLKAIRWRCRRGMGELDRLLLAYLEAGYPRASEPERRDFRALLNQSDDTLWRYFYRGLVPEEPELACLIRKIAAAPSDS